MLCVLLCPLLPSLQTPALIPITTSLPTHLLPSHLVSSPLAPDLCFFFALPQTPVISSTLLINSNHSLPLLPLSLFFTRPIQISCVLRSWFPLPEMLVRCLRYHRVQPVTQHPESLAHHSPDAFLLRLSPLSPRPS